MLCYDYIKQENKFISENIRNQLKKHLITLEEIEENNKIEMKNNKNRNKYDFIE